ncbi:SDR family oxidoreductase [Vibrio sinensis]|uniref:SDR family oxidoreductase n=1 Tax=Vibrio sinensis TaxID=2302434 RepID=A0A3A6QN05_9VIBR|nr:SDR family oxidoreductase [Vibrio sinensis]RJX68455.1 SDR family oxidoreductase [Vibrio sinensis]
MDIKSALVLVSSAGSKIGRTLAAHFASLGATVVICDKDSQALEETYLQCLRISTQVIQCPLPNYSIHSINHLFEFIDQKAQRSPNILINTLTTEAMPDIFDQQANELYSQRLSQVATTLYSFGQVTAQRMRNNNSHGVIVNVIGHDDLYDSERHDNTAFMVAGFTQSWAKQLSEFNIRVGGVVPCNEPNGMHWAEIQDELIRNTEYIVTNEYFSGRVVAA